MICQLCSYEFDESQVAGCSSCALNKHCAIICCPNCGYQSVDESQSKLTQALLRIFNRKQKNAVPSPTQCRRLSDLQPGQSATVYGIDSASASRQERLNVFGILPGSSITVEQRYPALVVSVGFTQLALEPDLANEILIE